MNDQEDVSLARRTALTALAMVGGAVGVVGMLSVVTVLVIGRAVGPSAPSTSSVDEKPAPATTTNSNATKSPTRI